MVKALGRDAWEREDANGEGGIRTHGTRKGSPVFETGSFNHSDTSPGPCIIEQECYTFHPC